ncbi:MAG: hypothetical protein K8W52_27375 [Deltaproteobacteria bacterium]|nr:hypothetical protein [Deltaproteobacteria bacterium]
MPESPSEVVLRTRGSLALFPDAAVAHQVVLRDRVAAEPALQVLVLLRDVRDPTAAAEDRLQWLDRAHARVTAAPAHVWFDVWLALARHDAALDRARAGQTLREAITAMLAPPDRAMIDRHTRLRDGLYRAVQALRGSILALTLGLEGAGVDGIDPIVATALGDRTLDDRGRSAPLASLAIGLRDLGVDPAPLLALVPALLGSSELTAIRRAEDARMLGAIAIAAGCGAIAEAIGVVDAKVTAALAKSQRTFATRGADRAIDRACEAARAPFRRERAARYLAEAVWEFDRAPIDAWPA